MKRRTFCYFAALGTGFMFVEISLMQKFVLFLGHPSYALSVVLASLLVASGLGAQFSERLREPTRVLGRKLAVVVPGAIPLELLAVEIALDSLLGLPFAGRVAVAAALLIPLGFLMGLPFPLGIRALARGAPELVPWGWAINGFLSVLSGLLAILLAMILGFVAVLVLAALVYALGLWRMPASEPPAATALTP